MNVTSPRLEVSIRAYLVPHLKQDGFSGSGRTFRRVTNNWIQVVNVQSSRYGGAVRDQLGAPILVRPRLFRESSQPKEDPRTALRLPASVSRKDGIGSMVGLWLNTGQYGFGR